VDKGRNIQEERQTLHNRRNLGNREKRNSENSNHVQGEPKFRTTQRIPQVYVENPLARQADANGKEVYIVTEKGLDFLQRHSELTELLKGENENGTNGKNGVKLPPQNLLKKI
jgi:hypothetical protein